MVPFPEVARMAGTLLSEETSSGITAGGPKGSELVPESEIACAETLEFVSLTTIWAFSSVPGALDGAKRTLSAQELNCARVAGLIGHVELKI
jgi:hypothetical protein